MAIRQVVSTRSQFSRYFYAGEMARPPKLVGHVPAVRADWQWSGEWWVTSDAVLTGAWQISKGRRLVMIFANVSDEPVTATVRFDPAVYGIRAQRILHEVNSGDALTPEQLTLPLVAGKPAVAERPVVFKARRVQTWEVCW